MTTMHYLDHNATSPLKASARAAMLAALEAGGNASSVHGPGRAARASIDDARERVARLAGSDASSVIFTSGGSEANCLALKGAIAGALAAKDRIVTRLFISAIEHESVRATAAALTETVPGLKLSTIPATSDGLLDLGAFRLQLMQGKGRALVSVMAANNETGVIQDLAGISRVLDAEGGEDVLLHVDAVQAAGKIPIDVQAWQATLATIAGHKFYGPKGVGALYVKRGFRTSPLYFGGEQERGRRAGTENVPAIVGLGAAAELAQAELRDKPAAIAALRDRMEEGILAAVPQVVRHGTGAPRVCNTSHLSFVGAEGEHLILSLDMKGIACSAGSACKAGSAHASHVLLGMGIPANIAQSAVRFSLGRSTTSADIDRVLEVIPEVVKKLRAGSPSFAS